MTKALVLSGGGSRGDFQLGAITALYEAGIEPDIICGTSVGSLNALMLSQGDAGLDELRRIWFGLRRNDHMWQLEDWWDEVQPQFRELMLNSLTGRPALGAPSSVMLQAFGGGALGAALGGGVAMMLLGAMGAASLAGHTDNAVAAAFTGEAVRKLLVVLSDQARAMMNLNPIRELMAHHIDVQRLKSFVDDGRKLRLACVGLNSGELCYVTETGELLRRRSGERLASGISVLDGAMASSAIATIFPPVAFAGDCWVDGGHREAVPLRAAIEAGATEIYVVCASPIDPWSAVNRSEDSLLNNQATPDFAKRHILDIASRALIDIHLDEMDADDVYPVIEHHTDIAIKLIHPEYPSHDFISIDPELIRVNYDYGYRVACDVLANKAEAGRASSSMLAVAAARASRLRKRSWTSIGTPWSAEIAQREQQSQAARDQRVALGLTVEGPHKTQSFARGSDMIPGELLLPGQSIASPDGSFVLIHQVDGNLVVYRAVAGVPQAEVVWASDAHGHDAGVCAMQCDGNWVVYDRTLKPRWSSGTHGRPGLALRLDVDGSVVLHRDGQEAWRTPKAKPSADPPVRKVTIKNLTPVTLVVRLYRPDDGALVATLPNGTLEIPGQSTASWQLPNELVAVKATFNGRAPRVLQSGEMLEFDQDPRLRFANQSVRAVRARIFDHTDLVRIFALPDGDLHLEPAAEASWTFPENIEKVVVVVNNRWVYEAIRGSLVTHAQDDRIMVRNSSALPVQARFYRVDDSWMTFTLPGGDLKVGPEQDKWFTVPSQLQSVKVVIAEQTYNVSFGESLIVDAAGQITRA